MLLKMKICQTKKYLKNYTKQVSKYLKYEKLYSFFIWVSDLANKQLISKLNKQIYFLLCFIVNMCELFF